MRHYDVEGGGSVSAWIAECLINAIAVASPICEVCVLCGAGGEKEAHNLGGIEGRVRGGGGACFV